MHDESRPGSRQMLVVAGSGRSGTSLFTGLTGRLGVHIPKPEVSANRSNPRGFGEPRWLRHPAEVMRSREIAYGTRTANTTRVVGWLTMMLGTEVRTRDLPRATVRYDDLLTDWRAAMTQADATVGMGLFERADDEQLAHA